MSDAHHVGFVDEQADNDRRSGQQDVADEARHRGKPSAAAEFCEIDSRHDPHGRAQRGPGCAHQEAPHDGIQEPAVAAGRRGHFQEKLRAQPAESHIEQRKENPTEPEQPEQHREQRYCQVEAIDQQPACVQIHGARQVFRPSRRARRSNSSFDNANTTKVMKNKTRPSSINAER